MHSMADTGRRRMRLARFRGRLALGALLTAHAAIVSGAAPTSEFVPFGIATEKWRRGLHDEALRDFSVLAQAGDTRSQLLLGMTLLQGKDLPRDVAQGFAWLQIAATDSVFSFGRSALEMARRQKTVIEPQLSGADLIHADRIANAYLDAVRTEFERRKADSSLALGGHATDQAVAVVAGCALDRSMAACGLARKYSDWSHSCAGEFTEPDVDASTTGPNAFVAPPEYPSEARRKAWEGVVVVQLHVDRSGFPCRIALLKGSGRSLIDDAVLESVRGWRLQPATKGGQPVESLYVGRLEYLLSDYALGKDFDYQRAGKILAQ